MVNVNLYDMMADFDLGAWKFFIRDKKKKVAEFGLPYFQSFIVAYVRTFNSKAPVLCMELFEWALYWEEGMKP